MTSDHHTTTTQLESALAEAKAKAAEDTYHLELLLEAEKASHTDTLVKLRLTEERLAASEAERERLREMAEIRKRDCVEAEKILYTMAFAILERDCVEIEEALYAMAFAILGGGIIPGDYEKLLREATTRVAGGDAAFEFVKQHNIIISNALRYWADCCTAGELARDAFDKLMTETGMQDEIDADGAITLVMNERPE
jgi:hypothetical protein